MNGPLKVLFSSAGRRVELMNCFRQDARDLGIELQILTVDCEPAMSAACCVADQCWAVPRCSDEAFVPRLAEICAANEVNLIIPTIDTELLPLARAREDFAALGTRIAVSDVATVTMARDKLRTADFLHQHGISSPRSVPLTRLLEQPDTLRYPVIYKHVVGSSSIGMGELAEAAQLRDLRIVPSLYMAQEKWIGDEYTVNMYFDEAGTCRSVVPHLRCAVRAGEVSKGITVRHPLLEDLAVRLAAVLPGARGALCFQSIVTAEGNGTVFEINARFGGGYPLSHRAGATFPRWLLEETAGLPRSMAADWQEGVTMLRYDAAVFLPAGRQ